MDPVRSRGRKYYTKFKQSQSDRDLLLNGMDEKLSIINKTKGKLPYLSLFLLKEDILGKNYSLSVAFIGEKESRTINKKYRGKNKPANILSFLLHEDEGEIVICPALAKREAKNFGKTFSQFLRLLVIHGMLHLKGLEHGKLMEKAEEKYLPRTKFLNK